MDNKMKFCPSCGTKLAEDTEYCTNCGAKITKDNFLKELVPTEEKIVGIKQFIINNFEIVHIAYFLIFLIGLVSAKFGFIFLLISIIAIYIISVTKGDAQIVDVNKKIKETRKNINAKQEERKAKVEQEKQNLINKQERVKIEPLKENTQTDEKIVADNKIQQSSPQVINNHIGLKIFATIAGLMNLFGVLGNGITKVSDASLYGLLTNASSAMGYVEKAEDFFNGSSGNTSPEIQFVSILLISIPIMVIVFSWLKSNVLHGLSIILSLVEVFGIIFCISYVMDMLGDYSSYAVDNSSNVFGMPIYFLVGGLLMMIITSIALLMVKEK